MNDKEWYESLNAGEDAGWKLVWERVVEPLSRSSRYGEIMRKYSLDVGDLMGLLYNEMIGRKKIELYRDGGGSFEGWLKKYAQGFVLGADPNRHGEISIEGAYAGSESKREEMEIPVADNETLRGEAWRLTHYCFRELWNEDPERCYIHLLKTRYSLTSEEIKDFLDCSSAANVDQIFSRSVKFMRKAWMSHDTIDRTKEG